MTLVPHFSLPFRFTPQAAVSEQDSIDEVADCCLAVLVCPLGFRVELPIFGIPDPTFSSPTVDIDELRDAVDRWEPRASTLLERRAGLDELVANVEAYVQVRTEV
jgi:hypothetical protein